MSLHIVFCGGGTAGHLYPGVAVAEQIAVQHPGARITFSGRGSAWERREIERRGHRYAAFACQPWPQRLWRLPRFASHYVAGVAAARRWLSTHGADVVVGLGGWTSVPMARAAVLAGRPLVLLEQNAIPGRVTRWLAPRATLVCAAMAEARTQLHIDDDRFQHTGNPVRAAILARSNQASCDGTQRLLVLGGSGGAGDLNRAVPTAIARFGDHLHGWQIVHQTGVAGLAATRARYADAGRCARLASFLPHIADEIAAADLIICRAGGTTLAELAILGAASIVVPFAASADDHQRRNALAYASAGACRMVDPRTPTDLVRDLERAIAPLANEPQTRNNLRSGMRRLSRPNAAAEVAALALRATSHFTERLSFA